MHFCIMSERLANYDQSLASADWCKRDLKKNPRRELTAEEGGHLRKLEAIADVLNRG